MDEWQYEFAERLNTAQVEVGAERAKAAVAPQHHPEFDGAHCVDCGVALPVARLELGRVRCVECQEREEAMGRG